MLSMFGKSDPHGAEGLLDRRLPSLRSLSSVKPEIGQPANQNPVKAPAPKPQAKIPATAPLVAKVPSIGQYLYHLSHDLKAYTRSETINAVIGVKPVEIQRVAKLQAKLKGRYLAMVVDLGNSERTAIGESEIRELRRAREMFEEVEAGLSSLRVAIESGDLELDGVRGE